MSENAAAERGAEALPEDPPMDSHDESPDSAYEPGHQHEPEPAPSYEPPPPPPPPSYAAPAPPPARYQRSPFIAGMLSLFLPGMGNVYNGLAQRGLINFAIAVSLFFSAQASSNGIELALLVPSMIFVWIFSVVDSVRQATLINYGVTEADLPVENRAGRGSGGNIAAGAVLLFVGFYGLLEAFGIDLSRLFDFWFLVPIGLGAWLVSSGLRSRRSELESSSGLDFD
ncbi:MAG: hypothetical protein AAF725_02140 [Acidobacteriota bacterium]